MSVHWSTQQSTWNILDTLPNERFFGKRRLIICLLLFFLISFQKSLKVLVSDIRFWTRSHRRLSKEGRMDRGTKKASLTAIRGLPLDRPSQQSTCGSLTCLTLPVPRRTRWPLDKESSGAGANPSRVSADRVRPPPSPS